ncbi:MAG: family 20 glycosylhydrolase [Cytophagaceae bacterium]
MSKLRYELLVLLCSLLIISCSEKNEFPEGKDLAITFDLLANNYTDQGLHKVQLTLENKSTRELSNKDWEIFFSYAMCRNIITDSLPGIIKLTHINGDFHKIEPTEKFPILKTGEKVTITILGGAPVIKYSDAPNGFYVVFKDKTGKAGAPQLVSYNISEFNREVLRRSNSDNVIIPTAETNYQENLLLSLISESEIPQIIPTPLKATYGKDNVVINASTTIKYNPEFKEQAEFLAGELNKLLIKPVSISEGEQSGANIISLVKKKNNFSNSNEAYTLNVAGTGIIVTAQDKAGAFYGAQSLRALINVNAYAGKSDELQVRTAAIEDAPQMLYRGMFLDASRNFHKKETVLKLLDILSFYKINKFIIHVGDDEGWRVEIKSLPELTEIGSKRGHTTTEQDMLIPAYGSGPDGSKGHGNGYYTRNDFIELIKYAKERNIEFIPKIDVPGHARAAIKSMDVRFNRLMAQGKTEEAKKYLLRDLNDKSEYKSVQLFNDNVVCPCEEGIYNFLETVVSEFHSMYKEAGVEKATIHTGGDEVPDGVWLKSPACEKFIQENDKISNIHDIKSYFLDRVNAILEAKGFISGVYEDAVLHRESEHDHASTRIREDLKKDNMRVYVWNNVWGWGNEDLGYKLANAGYPVVLSNVTNLYFDLAYTKEPEEPGLYWGGFNDARKAFEYTPYNIYNCAYKDVNGNPVADDLLSSKCKLNKDGEKNIIGMMGLLFSETLKGQEMVEYYTFPKVLGVAERSWAKNPDWSMEPNKTKRMEKLNKDWNLFANALGQREFVRLNHLQGGVNYRIPVPGAIIENGMLKANVAFPGMVVRYTTDGSTPNSSSPEYKEPVQVQGTVKLAAFDSKGRSGRIAVINVK